MKLKNLTAIILFVCMLAILAMSSVSAVDITVSGNSFDDIQSTISGSNSGDSIILGAGQTYTPSTNKNITITTDNVVIKGQSASSKSRLNGQGSGSTIMFVRANNIRLENLVFENVGVQDYAGAIWSKNLNLTIVNCEFHNNVAMNGPVFLDNGSDNTIILNCIFTNNAAAYSKPTGGGGGGAIDSHSSNGQIINCTFTGNSAIGTGGAIIFMFGTNNTVSSCTFNNNNASNGGAIATITTGTTLKITNTNFNNNKVKTSGGAIYSVNTITIDNSNFTSNTATNGGGIYSTANLNIDRATFKSNTATHGGAIRSSASTTIKNSNFNLNKANSNGGAIYATSSLSLSSSNFNSNSAVNGGGIYSTNTLTLTSTYGSNNKATNGGFIYGTGTININGGTFNTNSAKSNGGAVYGTGTINIKSSAKFNSNTATNGGAIFSTNNLNIVSSNFTNNKATSNGGAVYASQLTIDKGTFLSNIASSNGGAVYSKGVNTIKNKSILNSNTGYNGGAVYSSKTLFVVSSTLNNNKASNGGAVYSLAALTINNGIFSSNGVSNMGGGVYTVSTTTIKGNSRFTSNSASKGAAIFSNKNKVTIVKTTFKSNKAGITLSVSLPEKIVRYGKTKVNVKAGGYNNNIKVGADVPIWSNNYKNVKINGKTATKYTLKTGTKLAIKVNGKSVKLKSSAKKASSVEIATYPGYSWKDFTFTATYAGKGIINKTTVMLKVSAKIANTDVYNMDKNKKSNRFYPYRKDKLQTKHSNGKVYTKTIGQYTSDSAYLLGGEKVPKDLQKFLLGYKGVVDVNATSIINQDYIVLSSLKSKSSSVKGLLTQEKKIRAIQKWVATNTHYIYSNPALAHGGLDALKRIYANPSGEHTNCVGYSNLFVSLLRTAGVPTSQIGILNHAFVAAYYVSGGKWVGVMIEPQRSSGNVNPFAKDYQDPILITDSKGNKVVIYAIESVFGGNSMIDGVNYSGNGLALPLYDYQRLLYYSEYHYFDYKPGAIYNYVITK